MNDEWTWFMKALGQWDSTCSHDSSNLPAWDIYILKAPRVVCFLHRSPHNFNPPTWVSCRLQLNFRVTKFHISLLSGFPSLFPLHNPPTSFNTSLISSEEYLKDCKVYWTLTTPHLHLLSANDSKNILVSAEIHVVLQIREKVLGSESFAKL